MPLEAKPKNMFIFQKIMLGAIGAICLGLLKLINANFYLGETNANVAVGAYLTYGAYLVLGMAVGALFSEHLPNDRAKTFKSAFIMGLLAPSILIAIIAKPIGDTGAPTPKTGNIPSLGSLLISSAYAQSPTPAASASPAISVVTRDDLVPGIGAGIKSALGTQASVPDSVFVVGKSTNETRALKIADEINAFLAKTKDGELKAQVVKPQGRDELFVLVGDVTSWRNAYSTAGELKGTAVRALTSNTAPANDKTAAKTLLGGDVYKSVALFDKP